MREELARVVYPVLRLGLSFRGGIDRDKLLSLDGVQSELKRQLNGTSSKRGEVPSNNALSDYLGIRYPLVCWLDELFIVHSAWKDAWSSRKLETTLYRSNDRALAFWTQATLAAHSDAEALEVFYLCMLLGFRGELRDDSNSLLDWRDRLEAQSGVRQGGKWNKEPAEMPLPPPDVPPLQARDRLRRLLLALGAIVGCALLVGAFVVGGQLS